MRIDNVSRLFAIDSRLFAVDSRLLLSTYALNSRLLDTRRLIYPINQSDAY
jgi:hypothetical protein